MAKKSFRKVLSLFLALAMIVSTFMCLATVTASAATEYMFSVGSSWTWFKETYKKTDMTLQAGKTYMFTLDMNFTDSSRLSIPIELLNVDRASINNSTDTTSYVDNGAPTTTGAYRRIITFTMAKDSQYFLCSFGSGNETNDGPVTYGRPALYNVNSLGLPYGSSLIDGYNSDTWLNTGSAQHFAQAAGKWNRRASGPATNTSGRATYDSSLFPAAMTFGEPDSIYDEDAYTNQGASQTARFTKGVASYLTYTNNNRKYTQGNEYEIGFDVNDVAASDVTVEVSLDGAAQTLTNATVANGKYTAGFIASATTSKIFVKIGKASGATELVIAKPYIKEYDDVAGELGTLNFIHDIAANTVETLDDNSFATDEKQWNRLSGSDTAKLRSVMLYDYSSITPANYTTGQRVTFGGYTWRTLRYHDYYDAGIVNGTTYKITLDYRGFTTDNLVVSANCSKTNESTVVDPVNRKLYYTFTASADADALQVDVATNDYSASASIGHIKMMALDASGNETGSSLIDDINIMTLDWSNSSTEYDRVWNTREKGSVNDGICKSSIPAGYFAENTAADKAVYFPEGSNNYQVIVYKDADLRLPAGTYRLIMDVADIAGSNTVQVRKGTDIGTTITPTLISTEGTTKTYEFTVDTALGFGLFMGNYGDGTNAAFAYKNVVVKKYVDGELVGPNIVEPMKSNNITIKSGTSRTSAESTKWTSLNFGSGNIKAVDVDEYFPDAIVTTGENVLVSFPEGYTWKSLVYSDTTLALESGKTYQFTVNTKELGGSNSTFAIHCQGTMGKNIYNDSDYMTDCSNVLNGTVRTVTFTMAKTVTNVAIRIGNYSGNSDVAVVFANPKLVDVNGTDANLIAGMTADTVVINTSSNLVNRKWKSLGYASSGTASTMFKNALPENYFTAPVSKMVYINEATTAYNMVKTSALLKPSTTYTFEADWRSYAGAIPNVSISATNTSSSGFASKEATEIDQTGYVGLGHYTCTFTTQDDLKTDALRNIDIVLGATIKNNDYTHYGRGSLYFGNMTLKETGSDRNVLFNNDFSMNSEVKVTDSNNGSFAPKWEVGVSKNNGSRDLYNDIRILAVPANFFTNEGAAAENMMQFNGGSNDYIRQSFVLKSNTKYRLTYKYSYVNAASGNYVQLIDENNAWTSVTATKNTYDDATHLKTYEFTTLSNLRDTYSNAVLNFFIGPNGSDVKFYFGDVKLYELDGENTTGPNLVNNGGLNFGTENVTELEDAGAQARHIGTKATIGWDIQGTFEKNQSISVVPLTSESFPSYKPYAERLLDIVNMLIGKVASVVTGYTDLDNSGTVDLIDLVATKKKAANPSGVTVEADANTWKSNYVNGNNTTDTAALSTANMLATAVTGTTYYVDATNGSDSNNGTSTSTPWKSLSKVNSASLKSGDAVLFKCGEVFRPASISNTASLDTTAGVTYGSYGSGAKPVITGSLKNYTANTWTNESGNIWYTTGMGTSTCNDVGIVVYNYGSLIGNMKLTKAALAKNGDFFYRGPDDTKTGTGGKIYVYCDSNPATKYSSIEIGQNVDIISLSSNVTINNICIKYGGKHGMDGANLSNVAISNCQISYIGGAYGDTARLGNGVQLGLSASNCRVKNCYVTECFDAGLTFQDWNGGGTFSSINFSNNLVENCNYAIEWFGADSLGENTNETTFTNIYMTSNILRGAGYGWSYDERVGYEKNYDADNPTIGTLQTSLFRVGSNSLYTKLTDMYVYNNTFDRSKGGLIYWYWNQKNGDGTFPEYTQNGLHFYNNNYYQDTTDDNKILCFWREGFVQGISTAGLIEGAKRFESTDNPTGTCKFIIDDERVIDQS